MVIVVSICALTSDAFFSRIRLVAKLSNLFITLRTQTNAQREREREREGEVKEVKEVKEGANIMCTVDKVRRTSAFIIVFVVVFFCASAERDLISRSTIKSFEIYEFLRVYY